MASADRGPARRAEPPLRTAVGLLAMAALGYGVLAATPPSPPGRHLAAILLAVATGAGWAGWLAGRRGQRRGLSLVGVAVLGASGGALVALSPFGAVVVGVAALCAATVLEALPAAAVAGGSLVVAALTLVGSGQGPRELLDAGLAALLGLVLGASRRQQQDRLRAEAELAVARERSAVAHERAELLAERNRIAREVHDVLAHTLSALSVQLTALDSLVAEGADRIDVQAALSRSRRLVVEGLADTRRAVRALRDEPVPLADQLAALTATDGASFRLAGTPRPLPPAVALALVRVAQEALTNARRHAAGATVTVELTFDTAGTALTVTNTARDDVVTPALGLSAAEPGYGLLGMAERVQLLGGTLRAGPDPGGWRVRAQVPS